MNRVVPFPSPELRELLLAQRWDKQFNEALALVEYDWEAAMIRMQSFLEAENPPVLRFCAAKWILERAGMGPGRQEPPMRPSDV